MARVLPLTPQFFLEGLGQLPRSDPRAIAILDAVQNGLAGKSPDESLWVLLVSRVSTSSPLGALLIYEPATGRIYRAMNYYSEFGGPDLSVVTPADIEAFRQLIQSGDFDRLIQAERVFNAAQRELYDLNDRHPGLDLAGYFDLF